jgi:acetyltransferase-like isoleucine patch superfamily enzyme
MLFLQVIIGLFPKNRIGNYIRLAYWKLKLKNKTLVYFGHQATIVGHKLINLGSRFTLGDFSSIEIGMSEPIYIGNDVSCARHTYFRSANHKFDKDTVPINQQGHSSKIIEFNGTKYSIVIEDNVLISAYSIILSGTHIKSGSVIGAGSVVSGSFEANSIIVGNPARTVKKRINE